MKKFTVIKNKTSALLLFISLLLVCMMFTGCPDVNGLHNQNALLVTMEFSGFGNVSGDYSIPGNFDGSASWDNTNVDVVLKNGEGTSNAIAVTSANIQFSLCPTNEWTRPWYSAGSIEGNGNDAGTMWNFYIDNLDLNAGEITLVLDASSGTATPTIK